MGGAENKRKASTSEERFRDGGRARCFAAVIGALANESIGGKTAKRLAR